jgi:hypothetical protein
VPATPPATPHELETLLFEAGNAARAVAMQSHRAVAPSDHDQLFDGQAWRSMIECRFLAVALRWLEDIADTANWTLQDPILAATLQKFRDALPEARRMRNIGEHLPEYIIGQSHMQRKRDPSERRGAQRELGVMVWTGFDGRGTHLTWAGTNLDVDVARAAADRLYVAVRDAIKSRQASVASSAQTDP